MTQSRIADMATAVDAAALLVYRAAWMKDNGAERVSREASMAKLFATEQAQQVIDAAVQLWGGARRQTRDCGGTAVSRDSGPANLRRSQ